MKSFNMVWVLFPGAAGFLGTYGSSAFNVVVDMSIYPFYTPSILVRYKYTNTSTLNKVQNSIRPSRRDRKLKFRDEKEMGTSMGIRNSNVFEAIQNAKDERYG